MKSSCVLYDVPMSCSAIELGNYFASIKQVKVIHHTLSLGFVFDGGLIILGSAFYDICSIFLFIRE